MRLALCSNVVGVEPAKIASRCFPTAHLGRRRI